MSNKNLKPMIESGILASAAVVLALISFFIPVLGSFTIAIIPLPVIVLIMRHGIRYGLMTTIVTALIVGMFTGPLAAVNILVLCGFLGVALGYGYRRKFTAVKTIIMGSAAGVAALVFSLGISLVILGVNPISMETDFMQQAVQQTIEMQRDAGLSEAELASFESNVRQGLDMAIRMLPAAFVLAEIILAYINFLVAGLVLKRLGETNLAVLPPLKEWRMPGITIYIFLLSLVGQYWGVSREITWLNDISLNLNLLALFFGFLQGLALMFYFAERYKLSNFVRGIILIMVLSTGLFQFVGIIGLFDIAIDYRKRLAR